MTIRQFFLSVAARGSTFHPCNAQMPLALKDVFVNFSFSGILWYWSFHVSQLWCDSFLLAATFPTSNGSMGAGLSSCLVSIVFCPCLPDFVLLKFQNNDSASALIAATGSLLQATCYAFCVAAVSALIGPPQGRVAQPRRGGPGSTYPRRRKAHAHDAFSLRFADVIHRVSLAGPCLKAGQAVLHDSAVARIATSKANTAWPVRAQVARNIVMKRVHLHHILFRNLWLEVPMFGLVSLKLYIWL